MTSSRTSLPRNTLYLCSVCGQRKSFKQVHRIDVQTNIGECVSCISKRATKKWHIEVDTECKYCHKTYVAKTSRSVERQICPDCIPVMRMTDYKTKRFGAVYFVQGIFANSPIKIGFTTNFKSRMKSIQAQSPVELKCLATIEATEMFEWELQQRFAYAHSHYEWYHPVPELLNYIAELTRKEQAA